MDVERKLAESGAVSAALVVSQGYRKGHCIGCGVVLVGGQTTRFVVRRVRNLKSKKDSRVKIEAKCNVCNCRTTLGLGEERKSLRLKRQEAETDRLAKVYGKTHALKAKKELQRKRREQKRRSKEIQGALLSATMQVAKVIASVKEKGKQDKDKLTVLERLEMEQQKERNLGKRKERQDEVPNEKKNKSKKNEDKKDGKNTLAGFLSALQGPRR